MKINFKNFFRRFCFSEAPITMCGAEYYIINNYLMNERENYYVLATLDAQ